MGALSWILSGLGAGLVTRAMRAGRRSALLEIALSIAAGALAGLAATMLDFGGWRELDWRAATFSALTASAAIAIARLLSIESPGSDT